MSTKSTLIKRHSGQIVITGVSLVAALTILVWAHMAGSHLDWPGLLEKIAFAAIVAIVVRWLAIAFEEKIPKEDLYKSSDTELYEHLSKAHEHVWICQTWLPSTAGDATRILDREVKDTRLLLASFKSGSPIYSRIPARVDANTEATAKQNSASSVLEFVERRRLSCVKFNPIHHPGWIARIDEFVFWGATPVDKDNWAVSLLFHKAHKTDERAKFWIRQFELLWSGKDPKTKRTWSHDYQTELQYNEYLVKVDKGKR